MIPEKDLLSSIEYSEFGVSGAYGLLIDHLVKEMENSIRYFTANIPFKANKYNRPNVLWIEPSLHINYTDNNSRVKFIRSLHAALKSNHRHIILPLKQHWCDNNTDLVFSNGSVNKQGYSTFTKAVDATIRFADTRLMRNYGVPMQQIFQKERIEKEMEMRISNFEKNMAQQNAKRRSIAQQRSMREQFVQVRRFFERQVQQQNQQNQQSNQRRPCDGRQHSNCHWNRNKTQSNNTSGGSCRRQLFKK